MRDRDVPKPVLDRAGVDAVIGELVAAGMPQHVKMHGKWNAGPLADDLHQPVDRIWRERRTALRGEDIAAVRVFLSKRRQHAELVAADRMDGWLALLGSANMQRGRAAELDLRPLKLAGFLGPQALAVGHDDEAGVPLPPAPALGRFDQLLDLGRCQIFAAAQIGIGLPDRHDPRINVLVRGNLPVFVTWLDQFEARNHWQIPRFPRPTYRI